MAQITTTYKHILAERLGTKSEHYEADTVKDVLRQIKELHGKELYKLAKAMLITVNGLSIQMEHRYKTRLNNGDVVGFFPLAAGG